MASMSLPQRLVLAQSISSRLAANRITLNISRMNIAEHVKASWNLTVQSSDSYLKILESGELFTRMNGQVKPVHYQRISDYFAAQGVEETQSSILLEGLERLATYARLPHSSIKSLKKE